MPRSMTAFAQAERKDGTGSLRCEMRSVNHRHLDLNLQLPETLRAVELPLRDLVRQQVQRGKVSVSLSFDAAQGGVGTLVVNDELAQLYKAAAERLAGQMAQPAPLNPLEILRCPGVIKTGQDTAGALEAAALMLVEDTLKAFVASRLREGEALKLVILERLDAIAMQVNQIAAVVPDIRASLEQRLRKRLADLEVEVNADRLEQELVYQAQRMDVDEEIDRLRTHLKEFRLQLDMDEPVGRRLDFLAQELNREANTLASKSQGVASTQGAIEIKVCIEQIREQIQNIE